MLISLRSADVISIVGALSLRPNQEQAQVVVNVDNTRSGIFPKPESPSAGISMIHQVNVPAATYPLVAANAQLSDAPTLMAWRVDTGNKEMRSYVLADYAANTALRFDFDETEVGSAKITSQHDCSHSLTLPSPVQLHFTVREFKLSGDARINSATESSALILVGLDALGMTTSGRWKDRHIDETRSVTATSSHFSSGVGYAVAAM